MKFVPRALELVLRRSARNFSAVIVTGPRRAGKTTLLRKAFPRASYSLLEDPDVLARVKADPRGFLEGLSLPAVLDEIQNAPECGRFPSLSFWPPLSEGVVPVEMSSAALT
jgi:predicted AAA+ superfamily ATPase